jgi:hypothetical protein
MSNDEKNAMLSGPVYCYVCGSTLKVFDTLGVMTVVPCLYCLGPISKAPEVEMKVTLNSAGMITVTLDKGK